MSNESDKTQSLKKSKISEETAREQMQSFLDSYDIVPRDLVVEHGESGMETIMNRLVRAIMSGQIEMLDNGAVKHNLRFPKGDFTTLEYRRLNGAAIKEADKAKTVFAGHANLMASLSNTSANLMTSLDPVDISVWQRLSQLFMAS